MQAVAKYGSNTVKQICLNEENQSTQAMKACVNYRVCC